MYYLDDLAQTKMFSGVAAGEIEALLTCLQAHRVSYKKGEMIISEGDYVPAFGVLIKGEARSIKWDADDHVTIIVLLRKGSEIGVLLAARPDQKSLVSVQAQSDAEVLFIPYDRMVMRCPSACEKHERLLRNYIAAVAEKGLELHERMHCLLRPTLREKILTYLTSVAREQNSRLFTIPMNRNAMSAYLNAERSALSRELSAMKKEGVLDYERNSFKLM